MDPSTPRAGTQLASAPTARGLATLLLVSVIVVAVALRLYRLAASSLWLDEGGSLHQSAGDGLWANLAHLAKSNGGDHYQPLYFVLLHFWRSVAGSSVLSLRLLSVLFALAALAVLAITAARVYGRRHALITAALVALSAFFVMHAQEARPYALLMLLGSLLLLLFVGVRDARLERAYPPAAWALWVCFGVAAFASITLWLMVAGLAFADAVVDRHPRRWLRTWLPCAGAALPALGFYLLARTALDPRSTGTTLAGGPVLRNALFAIYGLIAGTTFGPPIEQLHGTGIAGLLLDYWPALLALAVATALALALVVLAIARGDLSARERGVSLTLLISFLAFYVLMFVFASATGLNWQPRHSFFLALPLFLLLPLAVRCPRGSRRRVCRVLGYGALVVIALANVYSLAHYYWDDAYARDDYRAVARYIKAESDPARRSVLLFGFPNLLRYYGDQGTIDGRRVPAERLAESVRALTGGAPRVTLIANRERAFWKRPETIVDAMAADYRFEGSVRFPYFTLYNFALR